jgi:hypothetical protein
MSGDVLSPCVYLPLKGVTSFCVTLPVSLCCRLLLVSCPEYFEFNFFFFNVLLITVEIETSGLADAGRLRVVTSGQK